ncbi:hypothetical protein [Parvibaculum sp.]|uniref:hypothetical protein n=1 Tax=Parvibaculum sp. TaxID=2024848 RepID=UPI002623A802|nr:hypothetical protein [Parvibaculum sp.]MCW5727210.1 hypothetical protein [Parvibaculum sp.]
MQAAPHPARLPSKPDPAILRLVRVLARQAAREDHAAARAADEGEGSADGKS